MSRSVAGHVVRGVSVDSETRCAHYDAPEDVVAIRFACCDTYFPCYQCHEALADHPAQRWPGDRFDELAILCGVCGTELSVETYETCDSECPACGAAFNPGCMDHWELYFER